MVESVFLCVCRYSRCINYMLARGIICPVLNFEGYTKFIHGCFKNGRSVQMLCVEPIGGGHVDVTTVDGHSMPGEVGLLFGSKYSNE